MGPLAMAGFARMRALSTSFNHRSAHKENKLCYFGIDSLREAKLFNIYIIILSCVIDNENNDVTCNGSDGEKKMAT